MSAHARQVLQAVAARATGAPSEVLTLRLGAKAYGIDILHVQKTRLPARPACNAGVPTHRLGVTNRRGVIVPIVDVRCRLGLDVATGGDTVTGVLGIGGRTAGAVVDAFSDAVALPPGHVRPAPCFRSAVDAGFITGSANFGDADGGRMFIPLDIERPMRRESIGRLGSTLQQARLPHPAIQRIATAIKP